MEFQRGAAVGHLESTQSVCIAGIDLLLVKPLFHQHVDIGK